MLNEQIQQQLAATVRTAQIIVGALVMGVITFGVVVVSGIAGGPGGQGNLLTLLAVGLGAADLVLCLLVPNLLVAAQRRKLAAGNGGSPAGADPATDAGQLALLYQTKLIIGAAMLEGGCFLGLVAYMLERQLPSLAMAGVLLLALIAHLPTFGRVQAWIDDQLRRLDEDRRFPR